MALPAALQLMTLSTPRSTRPRCGGGGGGGSGGGGGVGVGRSVILLRCCCVALLCGANCWRSVQMHLIASEAGQKRATTYAAVRICTVVDSQPGHWSKAVVLRKAQLTRAAVVGAAGHQGG